MSSLGCWMLDFRTNVCLPICVSSIFFLNGNSTTMRQRVIQQWVKLHKFAPVATTPAKSWLTYWSELGVHHISHVIRLGTRLVHADGLCVRHPSLKRQLRHRPVSAGAWWAEDSHRGKHDTTSSFSVFCWLGQMYFSGSVISQAHM